jgi:hypothetical protein
VELRTKSIEQSIEDTDEPGTPLRKDLTWWDLIWAGDLFRLRALTFGGGKPSPRGRLGVRPALTASNHGQIV